MSVVNCALKMAIYLFIESFFSRIFDDFQRQQRSQLYEHNFKEHTLCVTDVVTGYGGGNAIIVSASLDRTCRVGHAL